MCADARGGRRCRSHVAASCSGTRSGRVRCYVNSGGASTERRTVDSCNLSAGQGDPSSPPIRERRPAMSRSALLGRGGWICERRRHIGFGTLPRAAVGSTGPLCRADDASPAVHSVLAWMRSVLPFCRMRGDEPICPRHLGSSKHRRVLTQSPTPMAKESARSQKEQRGHSVPNLHRADESVDDPSPPGLVPAQYSSPDPRRRGAASLWRHAKLIWTCTADVASGVDGFAARSVASPSSSISSSISAIFFTASTCLTFRGASCAEGPSLL